MELVGKQIRQDVVEGYFSEASDSFADADGIDNQKCRLSPQGKAKTAEIATVVISQPKFQESDRSFRFGIFPPKKYVYPRRRKPRSASNQWLAANSYHSPKNTGEQ